MTYLRRSVTACVLFVLVVTTAVFLTLSSEKNNIALSAQEEFNFTSSSNQAITHIILINNSNRQLSENIGRPDLAKLSTQAVEGQNLKEDVAKVDTSVEIEEFQGLLKEPMPENDTKTAFNFTTSLSTVALQKEEPVQDVEAAPEKIVETPKEVKKEPEEKPQIQVKVDPEPQVVAKPTPAVITNKQYVNQYFPGLRISYPENWAFATSTKEHYKYSGLVERTVSLSKGDTRLVFAMIPKSSSGCIGTGSITSPAKPNINGSGVSRFSRGNASGFYSRQNGTVNTSCYFSQVFPINSSVTHQDYTEGGNVEYWAFVTVSGSQHLEEADRIVSGSSLR